MLPFTLTLQATSSLLIGGGAVPDGLHGAHVSDRAGRPIVPASALRGALRETLEALLRGADRAACEGGSGYLPGEPRDDLHRVCTLDAGRPCEACRLFGGAREKLADGTRAFSALVLGEAALAEGQRKWMLRPGVAITRHARSAEENRLFLRRTTATSARFVAKGWLRDDALKPLFEAAVKATTHIGAGRSRGAARVELTLSMGTAPTHAPATLMPGDVVLRVTLRAPTLLGVPLSQDNLRDTRREIPGAALRGAVGFALAGDLPDPNDPDFQALVDAEHGAHFGFLSPVHAATPVGTSATGHVPLTWLRCKKGCPKHRPQDDLLDRIVVASLPDVAKVKRARDGLVAAKCAACNGPLRAAKGARSNVEAKVRVVTRAALDRAPASVRDGALFSEVYLEAGNVFEGSIRNVPERARDMLARALALPLTVGRATGAGRGLVDVVVAPMPPREDIAQRGTRFDAALTKRLSAAGLSTERVGTIVPLTLRAPALLWPLNEAGDVDELSALRAALPGALRGATAWIRVRRFAREGSWDQSTGMLHTWQSLVGGSVYVLALPEGQRWRDVEPALRELEAQGLGLQRHQGFGEVRVFDRAHLDETGGVTMPDENPEAAQRRELVEAAERVMVEWAKHPNDRHWEVQKSQMNQLIGVCGEALCAEEIANYLRYQSSRERPPWGRDAVDLVLTSLKPVLDTEKDDGARVKLWRQYAVYLARAFTYQSAIHKREGGERREPVR